MRPRLGPYWLGAAVALSLAAPAGAADAIPDFHARYQAVIENRSPKEGASEAERLNEIFKASWEQVMANFPEYATYVGYPGGNGRWSDNSLEAIERRKREALEPLEALKSIDRSKLAPPDALNYDLFKRNAESGIEGQQFRGEFLAINQLDGIHQESARLLTIQPASTMADYRDLLARLRALPAAIEQAMALLEEGRKSGITPPVQVLIDVPEQVRGQIPQNLDDAPLLRLFRTFPTAFTDEEKAALRKEADELFERQVRPAYERLHQYLADTYVPQARASIACSDLPQGKEWYAYNLRQHTTTTMAAEEIHELGMSEVRRIREEMDDVIVKTGFKGEFEDFARFLRTDPQFYFEKAEDLLAAYRDIGKRIDPELIRFFGRLPRLPYGVLAIPAYMAKAQTTAYYMGGSQEAGRPGYFYANTYDLKSRPKWEMEALTLHEAVPGHHLQIALAQEMPATPEFRRHGGYTAFVEGWGLYAESLGGDIGLYQDPYSKYGQLTYEMWRAIRLVVDTGMHALGWSREQAIEFFKRNTGRAEHDIVVEVDRYIVWPGQACAYKIGELKIKELRARAKAKLGEKFDLRKFHDALLSDGALPLDILERKMDAWIEGQSR